ncbi:hypothetical protein F9L04_07495 [Brucella anthropi]|uniref:Uncharacterized protein n=1 Tax=Brucella anthropi TaxID=529 RepID=A0A6L3Z7M8_BRUAN|nr:hypothetical protein F9L04_07495 [Brucella anthropi]
MLVTERQNRLFNVQANVVAIYPLQGQVTEYVQDWLKDFIDYLNDHDLDDPLFDALPALKNLVGQEDWPEESDFLDALQYSDQKGFLFYGEWEMRTYIDASSFYGGPGCRRMRWVYADDIDAGFEAIIAAAEADHERQKAKAGAA